MTAAVTFVGVASVAGALLALRLPVPLAHAAPRRAEGRHSLVRRPPAWLDQLATTAGIAADPSAVWAGVRWAGPVALLLVALLVGPMAAIGLTAAAALAPQGLRPFLRHRLGDRRDAQLPASLERMASALRAGAAPPTAFVAMTEAAPAPLRAELRVPAAEIQHGASMATAVERWAARPDASPAVRLAGTALALGVDTGGEVARSIDRVAATLRERRELQAEVHALATQARASAVVLGLAPVGFTALVSTIEPGMARFLLTTPVGLACLIGGLGLEACGALWMARIVSAAA
jgi:tight adherence protein B